MQKKEGIKFLRSRHLESRKTSFWNVWQTLYSSKVTSKDICYIVLYSINIVFGIISFSRYWKMRKLSTHQRKKEPCTGGANTAFSCNWGQAKELGGQLPP